MPRRVVIGLILIFLNLFLIFSWLMPHGAGTLGRFLVNFLEDFFGIYNFLFLILQGFIIYTLLKGEFKKNDILAYILLSFSLLIIFSLILFVSGLQDLGGKFGINLKRVLYNFLGIAGSLFLALICFLLSIYYLPLFKINISRKKEGNKTKKVKRIEKIKEEIKNIRESKMEVEEINISIPRVFPPPLDLLSFGTSVNEEEDLERIAEKIESTFKNFKIDTKVEEYHIGPSVIRFDVSLAPGIRVNKILGLANDLALALAVPSIRFETPVPGKSLIGIEVPRKKPTRVYLREILESKNFQNTSYSLPIALGKDLAGKPQVGNLADMLHLLIAGTTGSGKSMFINTLILSLLYKHNPTNLKFLMIDPKRVELSLYNKLYKKYLWYPVITEYHEASSVLKWAINEMERRYKIFAEEEVRNIDEYKNRELNIIKENLPYIIIIIDELNDLMMVAPKEVEDMICRLAQKARAAGIHLVVATQRPSVDVITGLIKANIPSRIAFAVSSQVDSRIILDDNGAEKLLGKGDMLYLPIMSTSPLRLQAPFVEEKDIKKVVNYLYETFSDVESSISLEIKKEDKEEKEAFTEDPLLPQVVNLLEGRKIISTSYIQRRFRIGYNRAARILDILEEKGYVTSQGEGKPKKVIKGGDKEFKQ
ncbi:MAG: DNA translocase FtsK [Dictyoglomus sp.]|nr:DNA translocase FtsK [Dictyoglomus sp.]MCX7941900.1 DNA translocase FtsK [Dictyoglomaceae bacterium]MDW8188591.1 DNA translocase FtsK [Dictyoglomus sp.]